jgi:hypothetical protein
MPSARIYVKHSRKSRDGYDVLMFLRKKIASIKASGISLKVLMVGPKHNKQPKEVARLPALIIDGESPLVGREHIIARLSKAGGGGKATRAKRAALDPEDEVGEYWKATLADGDNNDAKEADMERAKHAATEASLRHKSRQAAPRASAPLPPTPVRRSGDDNGDIDPEDEETDIHMKKYWANQKES